MQGVELLPMDPPDDWERMRWRRAWNWWRWIRRMIGSGCRGTMQGVEVVPLDPPDDRSGCRHLVAVAVMDARRLIQTMRGVEVVAMDPPDDSERVP